MVIMSCIGFMTGCGSGSSSTTSTSAGNDKSKDTLAAAKEKGY